MDPTVSSEPTVAVDPESTDALHDTSTTDIGSGDIGSTDMPTVIDPPPVVIDHVNRGPIVIEQGDSPELLAQMAREPRGWYVDPHDPDRQRFWSGREFLSSRPAPAAPAFTPELAPEPKPQGATWKITPPSQVRSLLALLGLVVGGAMIVVAVYQTANWTTAVGLAGGVIAAVSCVLLGYSVSKNPDDEPKGSAKGSKKKPPAKSKRK